MQKRATGNHIQVLYDNTFEHYRFDKDMLKVRYKGQIDKIRPLGNNKQCN